MMRPWTQALRYAASPFLSRHFSSSAAALKKKAVASAAALKKKAVASAAAGGSEPSAAAAGFNANEMKARLENVLKAFGEKVKEAKSSAVSTERFQNLEVDLGHGATSVLKNLAAIAPRGNKINIVAFDPKQVKHIQTAVIAKMGVPAEPFGGDKQTLSVTMPQQTDAKKAATAKLIKEAFENLRNNAANKNSIASIRSKYINPLKKASTKSGGVSLTDVRKQTQEIEQLAKTYTNKLQELFKKSS